MKMERINDNQIKVILSKADLTERNIKLTELAYGGDKARQLFREIMELAFEEHNFDVDNVPIMVEAMPLSLESISIVVTKVIDENELEEKLKKLPQNLNLEDELNKVLSSTNIKNINSSKKTKKSSLNKSIIIFSFDNIDTVSNVSRRIVHRYEGLSSLYKENYKYYLLLEAKKGSSFSRQYELENILHEYGEKHISNSESKYHLKEHGEILVKSNAVKILSDI